MMMMMMMMMMAMEMDMEMEMEVRRGRPKRLKLAPHVVVPVASPVRIQCIQSHGLVKLVQPVVMCDGGRKRKNGAASDERPAKRRRMDARVYMKYVAALEAWVTEQGEDELTRLKQFASDLRSLLPDLTPEMTNVPISLAVFRQTILHALVQAPAEEGIDCAYSSGYHKLLSQLSNHRSVVLEWLSHALGNDAFRALMLVQDEHGDLPLQDACRHGATSLVNELVTIGGREMLTTLTTKGRHESYPLQHAILSARPRMASIIIEGLPDPNDAGPTVEAIVDLSLKSHLDDNEDCRNACVAILRSLCCRIGDPDRTSFDFYWGVNRALVHLADALTIQVNNNVADRDHFRSVLDRIRVALERRQGDEEPEQHAVGVDRWVNVLSCLSAFQWGRGWQEAANVYRHFRNNASVEIQDALGPLLPIPDVVRIVDSCYC